MNNFEWLCENDRELLFNMMAGKCNECKYDSICEDVFMPICFSRDWLEAEYKEPDSWEKIEWDACEIAFVVAEECGEFEMSNDICRLIDRCKALAGVE